MSTTTYSSPPPDARFARRAARVQAIRDGAHVHEVLGLSASYELIAGGEHVIVFRGKRFVGRTVDEAIDAARGRRDD